MRTNLDFHLFGKIWDFFGDFFCFFGEIFGFLCELLVHCCDNCLTPFSSSVG